MRPLALIILESALLFSSTACVFHDNRQVSSALGEAPPATPKMIEFATDLGMSWNPGMHRGMWRTEVDDNRNIGKLHIVSEAQCPDRYRVVKTGAEQVEQIFIDKTMYQRNGNGPWAVRPMPMRHMMLNSCGKSDPPQLDPARIRLLAEQFSDFDIEGPEIREINGHRCREWTRKIENFNQTLVHTACYDLETHAIIRTKYGDQVTMFNYDAPVDIKAPL